MSAYACGPGRGSEPGIGWNTAREMATRCDVWLFTSRENRRELEEELATRPLPHLRVLFVDWPAALDWMKQTRLGFELQHYAWQVAVYFKARALHRVVGFDIVHHVTIGRYWMPSFLTLLPVPFVWGPVGGGESVPPQFRRGLGARGALFEVTRECARWIGELDPFVRLTARRSAVALATTEETRRRMAKLGARSTAVLSQVGLSEPELERLEGGRTPDAEPVRFLSIGRLVSWKGFHLGLSAFARVGGGAEYWVIGTGPAEVELRRLAQQLGIASRVRFVGALSRDETLAALDSAHVLVHPSLHESGGMVCLEAMAAGKPVVCLDLAGPALQVTDDCGFKIPAGHPAATVEALSAAMQALAASRVLRERMGAAARGRAREFDWRRRGDELSRLYMTVNDDTACRVA
jgi:glycosyltransferase involved in cell wall biosynthesis